MLGAKKRTGGIVSPSASYHGGTQFTTKILAKGGLEM